MTDKEKKQLTIKRTWPSTITFHGEPPQSEFVFDVDADVADLFDTFGRNCRVIYKGKMLFDGKLSDYGIVPGGGMPPPCPPAGGGCGGSDGSGGGCGSSGGKIKLPFAPGGSSEGVDKPTLLPTEGKDEIKEGWEKVEEKVEEKGVEKGVEKGDETKDVIEVQCQMRFGGCPMITSYITSVEILTAAGQTTLTRNWSQRAHRKSTEICNDVPTAPGPGAWITTYPMEPTATDNETLASSYKITMKVQYTPRGIPD